MLLFKRLKDNRLQLEAQAVIFFVISLLLSRKDVMKKDFNFVFYACIAAVLLSLLSFPTFFFPRERLFSEDNPLSTSTEAVSDTDTAAASAESEVFNGLP